MIQIRHSIFETNSSSVHAICISRKKPVHFPARVDFYIGEYGWESGYPDRADYIYTAALQLDRYDFIRYMMETLESHGISCTFEEPDDNAYFYAIDHGAELSELINALYSSKDLLLRYLFSDASFVETGNDNSDYCPNYADPYVYDWESDIRPTPKLPNPNHRPNDFEYFVKGN